MKKKMTNKDKTFWAVIIPVLILFFAFNTLPMIKGFIYSFTNYKGYGTYEYVGFRNYIDLFTDARVGKSYLFTFKYAIVGTILVNFLSLVLALGLNSKIRFKSALRGIYFVPNILGGLVIFSALFLLTSFRELEPVFILDGFKTVFWQVKKMHGLVCWLLVYGRQLR